MDIAVDRIEVVRSSQSTNVYPGQTVEIQVHLIHDDRPEPSITPITFANQFTCILVIDNTFAGADANVTTQYQTITSMGTQYTGQDPIGQGPNPPFVVKFGFEVPLKKPGGIGTWAGFSFKMHATITVDDDDKSDNFRSGSGLRISDPEFEPTIFEEGEKDGRGPIHQAKIGYPLDLPFLLQNDGPAVDDIGIQILSKPEGWVVGGFEPITIYPNDEEELLLFVQIPSNPFLAQADETYSIIVRAYSNFYPMGPYPSDSTHVFRIKIDFRPGIKIMSDIPPGDNYLTPGETHIVTFLATNIGNGDDTYTFNAFLDEVHTKKGWKVFNINPKMKQIAPGSSEIIQAKITIPEDAAKFYNVNIFMSGISSRSGGTYEKQGEPMLIFASTRYAADIEEPDIEGYWVEPGRENNIKFNFTNMGNDKDPNQHIEVDRKPIGWAVYVDMSPIVSRNGVGPRTTVMLTMTVFVTETAYTTDYVSRPKVILKAFGGPFDHELDTEIFQFNIPPRQKIELSSPEPEKEGFIGSQVDFIVNVRNAGNWLDSFNISVDSEWAKLEETSVPVSPGDVYSVKLSINIPKDAAADTYPDTPFPNDPERNWYDGYKITVSGYSQNETQKGVTLQVLPLILHVQPFYDFEMDIAPDETALKFSTDHDQNRAVRIKINNTGNIADLIRLDWEDNPHDWLRLQNTYVDLPDDQVAYAVLNINPKKGDVPETGYINVTLIGESKKDPDRELKIELDVSLEFYKMAFEFGDPRMNGDVMEVSTFGDVGSTYSFQVPIVNIGSTNLTPVRFNTLYVVLYDGPFEVDRANITYLPVGWEKEVIFKFTLATPGPHVLTFQLEGDIPISDEGEVDVQKTLIIKREPQSSLQDDELPLWAILIPIMLLILFVTLILVFVVKYNQIFISPIDTGYDEDGEYKPWAVREKFKEEEKKELIAPPERAALPAPSRPGLPPGPTPVKAAHSAAVGAPRTAAPAPVQARPQPVPMGRPAPGQPMRPPVQQAARPPMPGQPMRPPMPPGAKPQVQPPRPGQ